MLASYAGFLLLIYFLLCHFCGVAAIPTHAQNATVSSADETALQEMEGIEKPWTPSPLRRGTSDLLLSCAVTIALAVWSSILVNIQMSPDATLPRPKYAQSKADIDTEQDSHGKKNAKKSIRRQISGFCTFALKTLRLGLDPRHRVRWKYKALWAFLNVMLPELALAVALDEWRRSRDLMKALHNLELQDYGRGDDNRDKHKRTPLFAKWNMTICFYAVMGGFYVPELPHRTQPSPGMSDSDQESIRTLVDGTMPIPPSAIEGQNEYCNWSLVKRCCDVSEERIKHRNLKSELKKQKGNMSREEMKRRKKELDDEMKPRHVLTTHGVLYMARLLKKMQDCVDRRRTDPEYTGASCDFRDPMASKETCNCPQHAKILENQFRDITSEIINDLSKSDWMGRVIFLVQSGWMIVQTMARRFSQLPITLLELHAAAHVAVAALQYIIWWPKPIDMVVMTPLSLPHRNFNMGETEDLTNHTVLDSDLPKLVGPTSDTSSQTQNTTASTSHGQHRHTQSQFQGHGSAASITQQHTPSQSPQGLPAGEDDQLLAGGAGAQVPYAREPGGLTAHIQGWWSGLLKIEDTGEFSKAYFTSQSTLCKEGSKQIAGISIPHHPFHGIVLAIVHLTLSWQRWPFKAILWFCTCLAYSSVHLAAWYWHFPTRVEMVAWHLCTTFTTASLAGLSLLGLVASLYRLSRLWGYRLREKTQKNILADIVCSDFILGVYRHGVRFTGLSIAIGVTPWLLARLYIFVESVISIRSVEKGTYDTVKWTGFIPHIG